MLTSYEEILSRRITPDTHIPSHDFLFRWDDRPCFARGELVALTGKAKSGKTFVCSLLMALAIRPQIMGISRLHDEPLRVVWIDTEQSEDSTQEILSHRIGKLINQPIPDDQFFVYNLRRDNWQERFNLANLCIVHAKPDLVIFDGIRDVVGDINNYTEAQNVLEKLLSLASWSGACIVCVLHQNKSIEDKTLRGALGTELQNKSYETYECQKDPDTRLFTLRQTATRKYDITQKLEFTVDQEGLPVMEQGTRNQEQGEKTVLDPQEIVQTIARGEEVMRASIFANLVKSKFPEMRNNYRYNGFLFDAFSKGIMTKEILKTGEVFYRFKYPQNELF